MVFEDSSKKAIEAFYRVYNTLGHGFLEKVYCAALAQEFIHNELTFQTEFPIDVFYRHNRVGHYRADIVLESNIIIEVKAQEHLNPAHEAQLLNYLRATNIEVGFLFNFGKTAEFKRKYYSNERKKL